MRIKSGQDLLTGLLFVVVGVAGLWIGADYPMGTAQRPGTGVLPYILSWCLIGTGGLLWLKAVLVEGPGLTGWAWRPVVMITLATIAFALLIDRLRAGRGDARVDDAGRARHARDALARVRAVCAAHARASASPCSSTALACRSRSPCAKELSSMEG